MYRSKKMFSLAVAVVFSLGQFSGLFAEAKDVFLGLNRTGVTATRNLGDTQYMSQSVSVVTSEDIQMTNSNQTTDILNNLPGVFIAKTGAFGRADVNIRGLGENGRQIGVMIDGRPDKMGLFGCSVTHTLPMNNVERIEVIRGPESVLYGSEAFGGVVNIVSKRATKKMEGLFSASGGTFNTQKYLFQQGSKIGKIDYFLSVNKQSTDGHITNAAYNASDYSVTFGYEISKDADLLLSGKYFTGIKYEPLPSPAGTWNDYGRGSFDATYKQNFGETKTSFKTYRSFGEHKFFDGFHSRDYTDGVMIHGSKPLSDTNDISAGVDYRYQFADVLNIAPASMIKQYKKSEYGVYVDDKQTFFDKLTLNIGARYNNDEYSKEATTAKFGAVYNISEGTIIRGIVSQGFKAPQLSDLFLWAGNSELKPEKVTNTEGGVRQSIGDNVYFDITVFTMKGTDIIQKVKGKKQNTGDFEYKGIETAMNFVFTKNINGQVNYSTLDTGTQTMGKPGEKAGASIEYKNNKFKGLLSGDYVAKYYAGDNSTQKIDDYMLLNTKVDYKIREDLSIFAAVDNITNKEYKIYYGDLYGGLYEMPGITGTLGMQYIF